MVLSPPIRALVDAVVVPDVGSWALWGHDLRALGFRPAAAPEAAAVLLAPDGVPAPLVEAVRSAWRRMPPGRRHAGLTAPWPGGEPLGEVLRHPPAAADPGFVEHHGDAMGVEGPASDDGLAMEWIGVAVGPLAAALPGGLVADLALDGDVVVTCDVRATLRAADTGALAPDPLAPAAWGAALAAAREDATGRPADGAEQMRRIVAVERERALSHAAWSRRLGAVLGWIELEERAEDAVAALVAAGDEPERARLAAEALARLLDGGRRLRARTAGLGALTADEARDLALAGPDARAAGVGDDARATDPRYAALAFEAPAPGGMNGDAQARIAQRGAELRQALDLAARARRAGELPAAPAGRPVEGPRGPVDVRPCPSGAAPTFVAPGPDGARRAAGRLAAGLEWSAALTVLASFDLSPWAGPEAP